MNIYLLQILILAVSFSSAAGALLLIVKRSIKKSHKKAESLPEYQAIIKEAHKKASGLLNQATTTAGKILDDAHETNENVAEDLDQVLSEVASKNIHSMEITTQQFEKSYAKNLEGLNQKLQKTVLDTVQNTQKNYAEQLSTFTKQLVSNGLSTQEVVDKKTAELLAIADQEIDEYKKQRMAKIDQEVKEMLDKAYRNVLKNSIPQSLQHELIIKSLEEAKKDEMFKL